MYSYTVQCTVYTVQYASTPLENLTDVAIAYPYGTKCSTISLFPLYDETLGQIEGLKSNTAKSTKAFLAVYNISGRNA